MKGLRGTTSPYSQRRFLGSVHRSCVALRGVAESTNTNPPGRKNRPVRILPHRMKQTVNPQPGYILEIVITGGIDHTTPKRNREHYAVIHDEGAVSRDATQTTADLAKRYGLDCTHALNPRAIMTLKALERDSYPPVQGLEAQTLHL